MWGRPTDAQRSNFDITVLEHIKSLEINGTVRPVPTDRLITLSFGLEELALVVPASDSAGIDLELSRAETEANIVENWNEQGFAIPSVQLFCEFKYGWDD